jgi:hypothetical protein
MVIDPPFFPFVFSAGGGVTLPGAPEVDVVFFELPQPANRPATATKVTAVATTRRSEMTRLLGAGRRVLPC